MAEWLSDLIWPDRREAFSVLIIDDDELLAETYVIAVEKAGMTAQAVSDPAQAMAAMISSAPDLVLLDMQMPSASGFEIARIIRQSRRFLSLPIVCLSAERDPTNLLRARRLGGDDFIARPIDPERLGIAVDTKPRIPAAGASCLRASA